MAMRSWSEGPFLVAAAPGRGQDAAGAGARAGAAEGGRRAPRGGRLPDDAAHAPVGARRRRALGLHLVPDASELRPPRDFSGVAVTYARVASVAERWAGQCGGATLVIADEAHHLGEELAWGQGFARAFGATSRWLLLSGTPFRSDQCPIPGVRYDDGVATPDVSYSYADAVRDGICRPVTFVPYDGVLQWRSGDDLVESSFADAVTAREAGRRYRTAISLELADGLPRILAAAHERLEQVRAGGHRDAGALVVAADGEHARAVARVLRETTGHKPTVVLHTEARGRREAPGLHALVRPLARRRQHGQRGRRHPPPARRRLRDGGQDAARLPPDRRALRAHAPRARRWTAAGSSCPPTRSCARTPREVERELRHVLRPPGAEDGEAVSTSSTARARAIRARRARGASSRWRPTSRRSSRCSPAAPRPRRRRRSRSAVRRARRGDDARLRAPRAAARQAPPAGGRPAPQPGRQPRRDQPLAEPLVRRSAASRTPRSTSSSVRSSCSSAVSPADGESPAPNGVGRGPCQRKR